MQYLVGAKLITENGVLEGKAIGFDSHIRAIVDENAVPEDAVITHVDGGYILPGLINLHIHGCKGCDVSHGTHEALSTIGRHLLKTGVTSYCPTLLTVTDEDYETVCRVVKEHRDQTPAAESEILGLYLEGIFLSEAKKGAHRADWLQAPDAGKVLRHKDIVKLTICAPELPGAEAFIREVSDAGITVALGHSNATYEQAKAGYAAGAIDTTHLFNAMSGLAHRKPGLVEAALENKTAYTELICDNFHVNSVFYDLVYRLKGDRLILITDSILVAGCPDGEMMSGGLHVTKTGFRCLLDDGTVAGSVIDLIDGLKNVVATGYMPLHEAVNCATRNPARLLRVDHQKGTLAPGKEADLLVTDEQLNIQTVYKAGRPVE